MAIVIRANGGKWQKATKVEFAAEAQLQKLIYDSPELIPTHEGDAPAVFAREAGLPGSGYTDLLGVDVNGNILVVETKLARNDEVRRKVIGQVLEYAAYLWKMTFDDFDSLFVSREATPVLDLLEAKVPGIVREEVRDAIASNLSSGAFQLFIAVDQMNDELEKIISYVSSRGNGLRPRSSGIRSASKRFNGDSRAQALWTTRDVNWHTPAAEPEDHRRDSSHDLK
jgi:hypothetical protein